MRSSLQYGHNSKKKKSTGRHRMTQNAITNPSLKSVLRNVGKNVTLSRNCERKSPLTRNRVPSSSAMRACRRSAIIARLFCRTLNWQYLCKAFEVFSVRPGSMLSFGRKIVVLVLASPPIDVGLSSLLISSMPERKCAFFEKGSSAGCVNRSWMLSRWIVISEYFSLVIEPFLTSLQGYLRGQIPSHRTERGVSAPNPKRSPPYGGAGERGMCSKTNTATFPV